MIFPVTSITDGCNVNRFPSMNLSWKSINEANVSFGVAPVGPVRPLSPCSPTAPVGPVGPVEPCIYAQH